MRDGHWPRTGAPCPEGAAPPIRVTIALPDRDGHDDGRRQQRLPGSPESRTGPLPGDVQGGSGKQDYEAKFLHGSRTIAVVVAPRKIGNHGSPRKRVKRVTPRATTSPAGHLWGMHVPDYLLFVAYGLFAVGVIACLAFVARNFEDEDPQLRRSKRDR